VARGGFTITPRGFTEVEALLFRLSDFQRLARIPLTAALGQAKPVMQAEVGSRKAAKVIKVRVSKGTSGLVGKVGPVSEHGAGREGYLAALFTEIGTGVEGPRHKPILPPNVGSHHRAFAFWSQQATTQRFGERAQLFTQSGRLRKAAVSRFGNAGQVVIRSSKGSKARPWFDRSVMRARPLVEAKFAEKFRENREQTARGQ
jgi:hypothetical protein